MIVEYDELKDCITSLEKESDMKIKLESKKEHNDGLVSYQVSYYDKSGKDLLLPNQEELVVIR